MLQVMKVVSEVPVQPTRQTKVSSMNLSGRLSMVVQLQTPGIMYPNSPCRRPPFHPTIFTVSTTNFSSKRRRPQATVVTSLPLPLLPFNMNEVLVPSETKTLHLYEARYLALLDESLSEKKKLFVHFVLDPISITSSATEASFAGRYGCLVLIEKVECLAVGALVSIRGIGRVKIVHFLQVDPFLKGEVIPVSDEVLDTASSRSASTELTKLTEALHSLNSLEIKLKAPKEVQLQTHTMNSLTWAESAPAVECDEDFIPSSLERISFVAFQPVTGASESELLKLRERKLEAMDLKDTLQRLERSLALVQENISTVAAKLAIQSIGTE